MKLLIGKMILFIHLFGPISFGFLGGLFYADDGLRSFLLCFIGMVSVAGLFNFMVFLNEKIKENPNIIIIQCCKCKNVFYVKNHKEFHPTYCCYCQNEFIALEERSHIEEE